MAWNMTDFEKSTAVKTHHINWVGREFGEKQAKPITNLMQDYYTLAFQRRPEFMAWSQVEPVTKSGDTEFTQFHYGDEVSKRIDAYCSLIKEVTSIKSQIPKAQQDAFYELIYYPVIGAANLNLKWLYAYKNKFVADQGRQSASYFADKSAEAFNTIINETDYFNNTLQNVYSRESNAHKVI